MFKLSKKLLFLICSSFLMCSSLFAQDENYALDLNEDDEEAQLVIELHDESGAAVSGVTENPVYARFYNFDENSRILSSSAGETFIGAAIPVFDRRLAESSTDSQVVFYYRGETLLRVIIY